MKNPSPIKRIHRYHLKPCTIEQNVTRAIMRGLEDAAYGSKTPNDLRKKLIALANNDAFWLSLNELILVVKKTKKYMNVNID